MGPSETNPVDRLPVLRGRASYKHCRGRARKGHPSKDCAKREVDRGLADGGPACSVGGLVPSQDRGDRRRHSKPRGPQGRGSYTVTTGPVPVCRTPTGGRTHSCFLGPAFFSPAPSCLTSFPSLGSHPKSSFLSQGVKGTPSVRRGPQKARKRVVRRIRRETRLPALLLSRRTLTVDGSEADALHPRSREPGFAGRGGACWEHVGGVTPLGGARLPMILRSLVEKGVYGFSNHVFLYIRPLLTPKQFSSERNLKRQVYNFRWFGSSLFIFKVNKHFLVNGSHQFKGKSSGSAQPSSILTQRSFQVVLPIMFIQRGVILKPGQPLGHHCKREDAAPASEDPTRRGATSAPS